MKLVAMVLAAALAPAAALANPNPPSSQANNTARTSPDVEVESSSFEMSTGQGRLGVMVEAMTPQLRSYFGASSDTGLLVADVAKNGPAARAGVKVGDVITRVDKQSLKTADDLISAVDSAQGNSAALKIHVIRDHKGMDLQASLNAGSK